MIRNYLKSAFRNLGKQRAFSLINVVGLALGMAAFLMIIQYASFELSYDNYHDKKDRLFRMQLDRYNKGELTTQWASGCAGIGQSLSENFGQVENYAKFRGASAVLRSGENRFRETAIYFATPSVFEMFTIPVLQGDITTMLDDPNSIVISRLVAEKYFGEEDPIGKLLDVNDDRTAQVTGVFQDLPENTHLDFNILVPWSRLVDIYGDDINTDWQWDGFLTYIQLKENVAYLDFQSRLPAFVEQQAGEELREWNSGMEFHLQPIEDIYLTSNFIGEFKTNGSAQSVTFLIIIATFIIVIAWVNYINLATSKSMERSKEVGIRKVMGSAKGQLIWQFLIESFITNVSGAFLAGLIVFLTWSKFEGFIGKDLYLSLASTPQFWGWVLVLLLTGTLVAGSYPAFVLSSFTPSQVLKGKFNTTGKGRLLRRGLVVFQFAISMLLIVGTLTVYNQIDYMRSQDLGVNIEKSLVVQAPRVTDSTYTDRRQVFRNEVLRLAEVSNMAISSEVPGRVANQNAGGVRKVGEQEGEGNQYRIMSIDESFVQYYQLEISAGRSFDQRSTEPENVLLNQAAVDLMGFDSPESALEKYITYWGDTFKIVGVLKNYHQESPKRAFDPMVYRYRPSWGSYFSLKVDGRDMPATLSKIETEYKAIFPGNPFEFFFLDEYYDRQYRADVQFGKVFTAFSILAIVIACLGLFGLASYSTQQRTKEIGVRKVLGASVRGLFSLVTREFTILVILGVGFAMPVSYFVMNIWLENFAYAIQMNWWLFILPAAILLGTSVGTVAYHTIKAARANPAQSLRYE